MINKKLIFLWEIFKSRIPLLRIDIKNSSEGGDSLNLHMLTWHERLAWGKRMWWRTGRGPGKNRVRKKRLTPLSRGQGMTNKRRTTWLAGPTPHPTVDIIPSSIFYSFFNCTLTWTKRIRIKYLGPQNYALVALYFLNYYYYY